MPLPLAGEEKPPEPTAAKKIEPTEGDRENEKRRQAIAEKMEKEYAEACRASVREHPLSYLAGAVLLGVLIGRLSR